MVKREAVAKGSPLVAQKELADLLEARCEHGNASNETCPECRAQAPMTFWEQVLERRSIADSDRMCGIEDRLAVLEVPWWRLLRKRWRQQYADDWKNAIDKRHVRL